MFACMSTQSLAGTHVDAHVDAHVDVYANTYFYTQALLQTSNIAQSCIDLLDLLRHWSQHARTHARIQATHTRTCTRAHASTHPRIHECRSPRARLIARDLVVGTAGARIPGAGNNTLTLGTRFRAMHARTLPETLWFKLWFKEPLVFE